MTIVTGVKCMRCDETIFSNHRHDWRFCGCRGTYVDGGRDYLRFGCYDGNELMPEIVQVEIKDEPKTKKSETRK